VIQREGVTISARSSAREATLDPRGTFCRILTRPLMRGRRRKEGGGKPSPFRKVMKKPFKGHEV